MTPSSSSANGAIVLDKAAMHTPEIAGLNSLRTWLPRVSLGYQQLTRESENGEWESGRRG
jgi:hypothetical protein